jgi:hypothetical protein
MMSGRFEPCDNSTMTLDGPPKPLNPIKKKDEYREVDYLMCSQCGTPC